MPTSTRATALAVAVAAVVVAVGAAWQRWGAGPPHPVAWRDVSRYLRGIELPQPARRIFKVPAAIRDFQEEAMPGVRPRVVPIDWQTRELVLVAPGPRSSTGYGVRILEVSERTNRIDVVARETSPRLGQRVEPHVSYPFRLLSLPRSSKRVSIIWADQ